MDWVLEEAIGEAVGEMVALARTPGGQERFAAMVERLLESEKPAELWLGTSMAMAFADQAETQYEAVLEGRVWSIYALSRVGESVCFYLGVSQDVSARYKQHLKNARCASVRARRPVSARVYAEMKPNGPGVRCETWLSGLTETTAKQLEAIMVTGLVRGGVALENQQLRGKHAPPNRHPEGSPGYTEATREYQRSRQATDPEYVAARRAAKHKQHSTPEGRIRHLACCALRDLKKGGSLTPTRQKHINAVGPDFIDKARIILAARGDTWPEPEVPPD